MKTRRKFWFSDLFFLRRRPRFGGVPLEWERPADDQEFQRLLEYEKFITAQQQRELDPTLHSVIHQDLADLEQILPTFFEFRQRAIFNQNRFYLNHWAAGVGIVLIVLFVLLSVVYADQYMLGQPGGILYGYVAALTGLGTLIGSLSAGRGERRKAWANSRRLAEELRTAYFKYLIHLYPYDREDRLQQLRMTLLTIRLQEKGQAAKPQRIQSPLRQPHTPSDSSMLLRLYLQNRVAPQLSFYKFRVQENEKNIYFTQTFIALLVTISAVLAFVSTQPFEPPGLLAAKVMLPILALLFAYFRQVYGWDRQTDLYRDTLAGYEQVRVLLDDAGNMEPGSLMQTLPRLVADSENVIAIELSQWGQTEGAVAKIDRPGVLEVAPIFGPPPDQPQFECDIFMIMPFAEPFQPIYRDYILPLARDLQLTIKRGDDFFSEHAIMDEVWAGIHNAELVIAECTGRNPNVFYELGIAHTLGKPAIMITQNIEDTPFDLRHLRIVVYEDTAEGRETLRVQLKDAISRLI